MSFSKSQLNAAEPRLTEFIVFYKTESVSTQNSALDTDSETKDKYCSMARRLYNLDGTLMQGSTGFFSLTQMSADETEK